MDGGNILRPKEVAAILKISLPAVYRLRAMGQLPARYKFFEGEKGWRFDIEDVLQYVQRHTYTQETRTPEPLEHLTLAE